MKTLFTLALLIFTSVASAADFTDIYLKEVFLRTCNRYSKFAIEDVRREKYGPESYDLIFYDLNYLKVDHILLIITNDFGKIVEQKEIDRETPQKLRFSVSERIGNEATVAKDVKAYLRANEINTCK